MYPNGGIMRILRQTLIQALESALEVEQESDYTVSRTFVSAFTRTLKETIASLEAGESLEIEG